MVESQKIKRIPKTAEKKKLNNIEYSEESQKSKLIEEVERFCVVYGFSHGLVSTLYSSNSSISFCTSLKE